MTGLLLILTLHAAPESGVALRRLAWVAGVNEGGPGRTPLRYATRDAQSFGGVLIQLGGVAEEDRLLLLGADRDQLLASLTELRARALDAQRAGVRIEVVFYYSGHSDEEGLLIRGERLPYPALRRAIEDVPADVRIAILDSCASGAFARNKGGRFLPPFLSDSSTQVRGQAILTSSSETEVAQESDRIKSSFFTHHLLSGLRGAADTSRDGRVTLNEAYQYAYGETLARTERTLGGAQHPAYDIALAGTGDLVMTDVRSASAGLVISEEVTGRLYVRDGNGNLVVELSRPAGQSTELGLPPGTYRVTRESGRDVLVASLTLADGRRTLLGDGDFHPVERELTTSRGAGAAVVRGTAPAFDPESMRSLLSFSMGLGRATVGGFPPLLSFRVGRDPVMRSGWVLAAELGAMDQGGISEGRVAVRAGWMFVWSPWRLSLGVGVEGGLLDVWQSGWPQPIGTVNMFTVQAALRGVARIRLGARFWLTLDGQVAVAPARLDGAWGALVSPQLLLGTGASF